MDYRGKWALVTGASSGIGEEFARQLSEAGANLVLVARRAQRLEETASLMRSRGLKVITITQDLSVPDAADKVLDRLAEEDVTVDILINNAGFGLTGSYAGTEWEDQERFIQLMVTAYAQLVHRLLPGMIERRFGRIVNVASVAGLVPPSAGHTLYGPSKSFLVSFSQSLAAEGTPHNVHVTALCPGFTYTEFHDVTKTRDKMDKLPPILMKQVEPTVRGALKSVEKNHTVFVPGKVYKLLVWLSNTLPRSLVEEMVKGQGGKFRKV